MDTIGKRIRYARKKKKMTLTDIRALTGLSTGNLSELENDKFLPSSNALILFKKIFDVSIDWLLTGEESQKEDVTREPKKLAEDYASLNLTENEINLIYAYRNLNQENKNTLWGYLDVVNLSQKSL